MKKDGKRSSGQFDLRVAADKNPFDNLWGVLFCYNFVILFIEDLKTLSMVSCNTNPLPSATFANKTPQIPRTAGRFFEYNIQILININILFNHWAGSYIHNWVIVNNNALDLNIWISVETRVLSMHFSVHVIYSDNSRGSFRGGLGTGYEIG